jgi:predicted AlkP superfamily pyrophosphatase or phosphodiesterase
MIPVRLCRLSRLITLALVACAAVAASAAPVLMISIDGLKPEYITHADEHGLKIPTLRRFMQEGTYADGVIAVLPTVTYPDHTTLITGAWPAEHGILNNQVFDPEGKLGGAWYWYADSIRVPTLWDAAHKAGIGTASVSWPVSVDATSVDTLIPEYWRTAAGEGSNEQDRYLMNAISRPDGALAEMEKRLGPYMMGNDTSVKNGDAVRTRFALDIIRNKMPGFMTIHLSAMDESEHEAGIFSAEADKTLEAVDGMVAELMAAALQNDPQTRIVIVSDHGFLNVAHIVNFYIPFVQAGLISSAKSMGSEGATASWKVQLWTAGGLTAIMLNDPGDAATKEQVHALLTKLAADPENGIDQVLDADQIRERGGFTGATYLIVMKQGYTMGSALTGPLVVPQSAVKGSHIGSHGFLPQFPEMHSSFFILGEGVAHGRDLGTIDMRLIAPTVAGILGVDLPAAKQPKLRIGP